MKRNKSKINTAISQLNNSSIFALSKCSNELAHSNFWAWLMGIKVNGKNIFVDVFIPNFSKKYKVEKIYREHEHMDIYVECEGNYCFVIENKLKAIPTEEQLKRYDEQIEKNNHKVIAKVLTGIYESNLDNWTPVTYTKISKRIKSKLNSKLNKEDKIVILLYLETLNNINLLIKQAIEENKEKYIFGVPEKYAEIKMDAITMKVSASNFCDYIRKKITNKKFLVRKDDWSKYPTVSASYSNGEPIITVVYKKALGNSLDDENEIYRIGVQIQGAQFRVYAGRGKQYKGKILSKEGIYNSLLKKEWFENYKDKKIRNKESSMKDFCCKFSTNNYMHVYQYWNINEKTKGWKTDAEAEGYITCDYAPLMNYIDEELIRAKEIIEKDSNIF